MSRLKGSIPYPRKKLTRGIVRLLGRGLLPVLFNMDVVGEEHYPKSGPLIVVGNHVAVMEAVMMAVMPPFQVEFMGSMEIPHEKITQLAIRIYGTIPIYRGIVDRKGLRDALGVLEQGGVIGIFPEGGLWDPGAMRSQTGVSWLSAYSGAPVLPIGFGYTMGALQAALKLQRPRLKMSVGPIIKPLKTPKDRSKKRVYEEYAEHILEEIRTLIPNDEPSKDPRYVDEQFDLKIKLINKDGKDINPPEDLWISTPSELAKFFHRPAILKIFQENLDLPTEVLSCLDQVNNPHEINKALMHVLDYLNSDNPYLLTYRFGPKTAEKMEIGLQELSVLSKWAVNNRCDLKIQPIRMYKDAQTGEEVNQLSQGKFTDWM